MSDLTTALKTLASEKDWELMAAHAGIPVTELQTRIFEAFEALADGEKATSTGSAVTSIKLSAPQQSNDCVTQDFDISLFGIVGLKGSLEVCGSSISDFSATLKACLVVAGVSVWCTTYVFDPHNINICFSPNVGFAKAELCFRLENHTNKICLALSGKACIWSFGWECASFDETLFCIPI